MREREIIEKEKKADIVKVMRIKKTNKSSEK